MMVYISMSGLKKEVRCSPQTLLRYIHTYASSPQSWRLLFPLLFLIADHDLEVEPYCPKCKLLWW